MRDSRRAAIAAIALLVAAPLPVASAISAAAIAPPAPSTLGLDDIGDGTAEKIDDIMEPIDDVLPEPEPEPHPEPEKPVVVPEPVPEPEPERSQPKPAPKPPTTMVPKPAPDPTPVEDEASGTGPGSSTGSGSTAGSGSGRPTSGGTASSTDSEPGGTSGGSGLGPTLLGVPQGAEFASADPNASSVYASGMSPLLPEANAGDPNIRSLLIASGQRSEAISPVADETAGSVTGLLVLGALASLMLYGSAAYLKFGKRRPVTGRHKS